MSKRRILVTGGTGLIGRGVVGMLASRGDRAVALVRPGSSARLPEGVEAVCADLTVDITPTLAQVGPVDAVIHLAQAPGWHDFPERSGDVVAVAVAAAARLAEFAARVKASHFVYASSGGIYGPQCRPIREHDPILPLGDLTFYLAAKAVTESLLSHFRPYLTVHVLRPFFVYGPTQRPPFLMARLVQSVASGTPIKVAGGRGPRLNPIHADDAATAFVRALDLVTPLVANLAGPTIVDLRQIAEMAGQRLGSSPAFDMSDEAARDYVADIETMCRCLGVPQTAIAAGLETLLGRPRGDPG